MRRVVVLAEMAAPVMAVVGIAVVGEIHRDDRPQVRRPERGDLEGSKADVGDPHHVDIAVAERLRSEPLDGVVAVPLLSRDILIRRDAAGCSGTADVYPGYDVSVLGQVGVEPLPGRDFVLAVGDVLHHYW